MTIWHRQKSWHWLVCQKFYLGGDIIELFYNGYIRYLPHPITVVCPYYLWSPYLTDCLLPIQNLNLVMNRVPNELAKLSFRYLDLDSFFWSWLIRYTSCILSSFLVFIAQAQTKLSHLMKTGFKLLTSLITSFIFSKFYFFLLWKWLLWLNF